MKKLLTIVLALTMILGCVATFASCSKKNEDLKFGKELLTVTDLVLLDIKFLDKESYDKYCKGDFEQVISFLRLTNEMNIPLWIRQVIVPGINDGEDNIHRLLEFLQGYENVKKIELLPFRKLCIEKYESLGIPFPLLDYPEGKKADCTRLENIVRAEMTK